MLLSVIMPNYNHGEYLEERIRSILAQLDADSELVIVDDASTDNSLEVIAKIQDKRVRLIKNPLNLGVVPSANIALRAARGKYIAPFGADDRILDGFVEKTMGVLLAHPEIPMCCSDPSEFHTDFPDQILFRSLLDGVKEPLVFTPKEFVKICKKSSFYLPGHTLVVKRDELLRFGGYDESLGSGCDWFLHHSIALDGGVAYVPQTLALWRKHQSNYSIPDRKRKKGIYRRILELLHEKKHHHLRRLFKQSTLLRVAAFTLFSEILLKPKDWDVLGMALFHAPRFLVRRWVKWL